jgi:hypothetical protein
MTAQVVSLGKRRIKRARNVVRYRKLRRLEMELLLAYVLKAIDQLQADLDHAVAMFRQVKRKQT